MVPTLIGGIIFGTIIILVNCYGLYWRIKNHTEYAYIDITPDTSSTSQQT